MMLLCKGRIPCLWNILEQPPFSTRHAPLATADSTMFLASACIIAWVTKHEVAVAIIMDYIYSACSCIIMNIIIAVARVLAPAPKYVI